MPLFFKIKNLVKLLIRSLSHIWKASESLKIVLILSLLEDEFFIILIHKNCEIGLESCENYIY